MPHVANLMITMTSSKAAIVTFADHLHAVCQWILVLRPRHLWLLRFAVLHQQLFALSGARELILAVVTDS